jgi:hypothetical protein
LSRTQIKSQWRRDAVYYTKSSAMVIFPPPFRSRCARNRAERPEDFHLKADAVAMSLPVEIATVATEVLGLEVILVGNLRSSGEAEIHIRCSRDFRSDPGAMTTFYYDLSQLQIFDAETTRALKRPIQN